MTNFYLIKKLAQHQQGEETLIIKWFNKPSQA